MNDICVRFGENQRLHGILTKSNNNSSEMTVLIISAGFTSTQGPYRLNTLICRELAAQNINALRFDLGGLGESLPHSPEKSILERTQIDIKDAIDFLEQQNLTKNLVIMGLCSGAEDSFQYAGVDSRVSGVLMIDPHSYPSLGFYLRYYFGLPMYLRILAKTKKIIRQLTPKSRKLTITGTYEPSLVNYQYLPKKDSCKIMQELINRNTLIHYIYTGGVISRFNYPKQVKAMFSSINLKQLVSVDHIPNIEHTQVHRYERKLLIDSVTNCLVKWKEVFTDHQTAGST